MTAGTLAKPRFGLLRQRDFRLLWIGESASSLGSAVTGVGSVVGRMEARAGSAVGRTDAQADSAGSAVPN